jgi:hypothetical protein
VLAEKGSMTEGLQETDSVQPLFVEKGSRQEPPEKGLRQEQQATMEETDSAQQQATSQETHEGLKQRPPWQGMGCYTKAEVTVALPCRYS